jgi:hypothetical protein
MRTVEIYFELHEQLPTGDSECIGRAESRTAARKMKQFWDGKTIKRLVILKFILKCEEIK